ncbi:MAG: hypothetical protein U0939_22240 [Pirellulales bacterium]
MSDEFDPQSFFNAMRAAWEPFSRSHRIIPFCTPVFARPTALVIGTNHSDFVDGGGIAADQIADELAARLPKQSTFLFHDHKFARGLLEVCRRAGIRIDETWIGMNRCAVQTGPTGIQEIIRDPQFAACQASMDQILHELIAAVVPANVVLVGKYAAGLCYPHAPHARFESLTPRDMQLPGGAAMTRVIPIPHPSRATFWQPAAEALASYFVR